MNNSLIQNQEKTKIPYLHLVEMVENNNSQNKDNLNSTNKLNIILPNSNNEITNYKVEEDKELAEEHKSDPIKNIQDIQAIIDYFVYQKKYRNAMLFVIGICTGLRCSDLRQLKFSKFINDDGTFKDKILINEQKTRHTRGKKKNKDILTEFMETFIKTYQNQDINLKSDDNNDKLNQILNELKIKIQNKEDLKKQSTHKSPNRTIYVNDLIKKYIILYLNNTPNVTLNDYMFKSESNNGSNKNKPMTRQGIETFLKKAVKNLNINIKAGTHCMRKTFAYQVIMSKPINMRYRAVDELQMIFGHSSRLCTLRYAGITDDELKQTYKDLYSNNLNTNNCTSIYYDYCQAKV